MQAPSARRILRGFRVWSSAPDATRLRRPTDILMLIGAGLLSIAVAIALHHQTAPPVSVTPTPPTVLVDIVDWVCEFGYALVAFWALLLVVLAIAARGRRHLLLDYVVGAVISLVVGLLVSRPVDDGWTHTLRQILTADPSPVDVVGPLAIATAIIVIASPHVTRPLRWTGRTLVVLGAVATVVLGITHAFGGFTAILVGIVAAAATHLLLGTPSGHATERQVADGLHDVGVEAQTVELTPQQRVGVATFRAVDEAGTPLHVKVYGRDAWDDQFVGSFWTALTRKGETLDLFSGRRHRVEHEAMTSLFAQRAGVPVIPVVAAGVDDSGDALLVTEMPLGSLADLSVDELDTEVLTAAWSTLLGLHRLGIAHRSLELSSFVRRSDGSLAITDLSTSHHAAGAAWLMTDRVRLLVATAVATTVSNAVSAAVAALGSDGIAELLPYLQRAVLDRSTRNALRALDWSLDDLRAAAVEAAGVEPPVLLDVRRVTVKSIGLVVLVGVMAYAIIGMLAGVDFESIKNDLSTADKTWLWVALALSPVVEVAFSFSTLGASMARLRFVPVLMLQFAIQFIALTLPATAARLALSVRFFQRFGVPPAGAISIGVVDSFSGFIVQVVLLAVILLSGLPGFTSPLRGDSTTSSGSSSSGFVTILVLAVALVGIGLLVVLVVPRLRNRLRELIPRVRTIMREQTDTAREALRVVRHPGKLASMLLGNFGAQLLQAIILGFCLYSFGYTAHLSQLILINTAVSLFAGLMPVPGGMGVAEAGYTAGLQAIGIPPSVAMSTAIAFRLATFYLPPIWGSFAMRWLRRHEYV